MNIEDLGFTKQELQQRVIDQLCGQLMETTSLDEDGDLVPVPHPIYQKLSEAVRKHIDERVAAVAAEHILPRVTEMIESLSLQETNRWGEKSGKSVTFIEYLTARAEAYMQEMVDYDGKGKSEKDNWNFKGTQTRITHLVHQHLHYSIESAMKDAMKTATGAIAKGIEETVKIKLAEVQQGITASVKLKQ